MILDKCLPTRWSEHFKSKIGNEYCIDCRQADPSCAVMAYGILVCQNCAAEHRSLQDNSVVAVDSLDDAKVNRKEILKLEIGGNKLWGHISDHFGISDFSIAKKYTNEIALCFSRRLHLHANNGECGFSASDFIQIVLTCRKCGIIHSNFIDCQKCNCASSNKSSIASDTTSCSDSPTSYQNDVNITNRHQNISKSTPSQISKWKNTKGQVFEELCIQVKCTLCGYLITEAQLQAHICDTSNSKPTMKIVDVAYEEYLGVEGIPLGLGVKKQGKSSVVVSSLVKGCEAEEKNISIGSEITHVNGESVQNYEIFMDIIKELSRPIQFQFQKKIQICTTEIITSSNISQKSVVFNEYGIGCSFNIDHDYLIVSFVESGGEAFKNGVKVGWIVFGLNGLMSCSPLKVLNAINSHARPFILTFQSKDMLIRGWSD